MIKLKELDEYLDKIEEEIDKPPTLADIKVIDKYLDLSAFGLKTFVDDLGKEIVEVDGEALTDNLYGSMGTLGDLVEYLKYTLHHIIIIRCDRYTFLDYYDRKLKKEKSKYMEYSEEVDVPEKHLEYLTALKRWRRNTKIPRITEKTFLRFQLEKFYHFMDDSLFKPSIQDKIVYMLYCVVGLYICGTDDILKAKRDDFKDYELETLESIKRFRYRVLNEN